MKKILVLFIVVSFLHFTAKGQNNVVYLYDNPSPGLVSVPYPPGTIPNWYGNLEKYWFYRYRLVNDFMKIGEKAGESHPAFMRTRSDKQGYWPDMDRYYGYYLSYLYKGTPWQNLLSWSTDGTCALGHYLTALACEYRQLSDWGLPTTRTLYELKYAQNALNRLCNNSYYYESHHLAGGLAAYPGYATGSICDWCPADNDFYFLRDDVPFLTFTDPYTNPQNYQHFNRLGITDFGTNDTFLVNKAIGAFRTSYFGPNPGGIVNPTITGGAIPGHTPIGPWDNPDCESQDQLQEIFIGEAMIALYLTGSEPDAISIREQAQKGVAHLMEWPGRFSGGYPVPYWSIPDIVDPTSCAKNNCSQTGIFGFSAPAATAASHSILNSTGANPSYTAQALADEVMVDLPGFPLLISDYVTMFLFEYWFWPSCDDSGPFKTDIAYTDGYVCFSRSWPTMYIPPSTTGGIDNYLFYLHYLTSDGSWGAVKNHSGHNYFGTPQYPILYQLLENNDRSYYNNGKIMQILDNAPPCGPWNNEHAKAVTDYATANGCSLSGGIDGTDYYNCSGKAYPTPFLNVDGSIISEWSGNDMLSDPTHRYPLDCYRTSAGDQGYADEFYGGDYLELFNLFSLEQDHLGTQYLNGMINPYYHENYDINYPDNINFGSINHKLKLNWLEYLSAIDKIHATGEGWVEFRAAKVMDLNPGFEAEYGSFFNGYVRDYTCHGDHPGDGPYNFATVNETGPSYRPVHGGSTDSGDMPVAYFPNGYNNFKGEHKPPIVKRDTISINYDSIMNNPTIRGQVEQYFKYKIINGITDSDLLGNIMDRYGWNRDTIAKYKSMAPETDSVNVNLLPNPTNDIAFISFILTKDKPVKIKIMNALGQDFTNIVENYEPIANSGFHKVMLHSENLIAGLYMVSMQIGSQIVNKRLIKM